MESNKVQKNGLRIPCVNELFPWALQLSPSPFRDSVLAMSTERPDGRSSERINVFHPKRTFCCSDGYRTDIIGPMLFFGSSFRAPRQNCSVRSTFGLFLPQGCGPGAWELGKVALVGF